MAKRLAVRGLADIVQTIRAIGTYRVLTSMTLLAGLTSFMIGNAYHAQMPGFAIDLGHGDPGVAYSVLLAADAAGALLAGIALEAWGRLKATPQTAIVLAILWSLSLLAFASVGIYTLAIALLFAAGFFELSFNTMAQTLVQLNAPVDIRGRVVGLFNMAGLGMRAFSGITVGVLGAGIGIHWSLGLSAACCRRFCCCCFATDENNLFLADIKRHRRAKTHRGLLQFGRNRREWLRAADHRHRLAVERRMTRRSAKPAWHHLPAAAERKTHSRDALLAGRLGAGRILLEALQMRGDELIVGRDRRR